MVENCIKRLTSDILIDTYKNYGVKSQWLGFTVEMKAEDYVLSWYSRDNKIGGVNVCDIDKAHYFTPKELLKYWEKIVVKINEEVQVSAVCKSENEYYKYPLPPAILSDVLYK